MSNEEEEHGMSESRVKERDKPLNEQHKRGRFNYGKANFENVRKFSEIVVWSTFNKQETYQKSGNVL